MSDVHVNSHTFHADQVRAFLLPAKYKVIRAGRRWGKTTFAQVIAVDDAIKGRHVGWFAPNYKISSPAYDEISEILKPITVSSNKNDGKIACITGGSVEVWTLENDRAGRSRHYHRVIIDEAAYGKPDLFDVWERAIKPTLFDYEGHALVISNTNGIDPDNFLYKICRDKTHGFREFHAPTRNNPDLPKRKPGESEIDHAARRIRALDKLRKEYQPLVYQQEFESEFVDFSGNAFFSSDSLLLNGQPVDYPTTCDAVYAIIDTATKTGKENDGTSVTYFALNGTGVTHKLTVLDYDYKQIEGADLEVWLPTIFSNLEMFAAKCGARGGSLGVWIEDKSSGMVLLQQATRRGYPAQPCPEWMTSLGKNERAISISGYVYQGLVKFSRIAYEHVLNYKGTTRNHLWEQVVGFRPSIKDLKLDDDCLDTFTYGVAISLGDSEGF